jgi:hypothetical protein
MKTRAAKFVAAIVASMASGASVLAAPDNTQPAADKCLTSPGETAPGGGHWRYRIERGTGRHCWYLKGAGEKAARSAPEPTTAATEEPAPARSRKKAAAPSSVSEAHAEFATTPAEQDVKPAPVQSTPAPTAGAPGTDGNQLSSARPANMLAPSVAARWPDPMSTANPAAASPPPAPAERSLDAPAPVAAPAPAAAPAPSQVMPRAVPPTPVAEMPMSLPMQITVVAGGLSVLAVLLSILFGWLSSRAPRLSPSAPMPPLDLPEQPRRPGDLYRQRKQMSEPASSRHAA